MKKPKHFGYAETKEAAKELRREIQKIIGEGRKAHYMKLPPSFSKGKYKYWVWCDGLDNETILKEIKES